MSERILSYVSSFADILLQTIKKDYHSIVPCLVCLSSYTKSDKYSYMLFRIKLPGRKEVSSRKTEKGEENGFQSDLLGVNSAKKGVQV